jgi:hypothetical protein
VEDAIILKPARVQTAGETLAAVRKKIKKLGLKENDVKTAVRWARNRKK